MRLRRDFASMFLTGAVFRGRSSAQTAALHAFAAAVFCASEYVGRAASPPGPDAAQNFNGQTLQSLSFAGENLAGSTFVGSQIYSCDFSNADLQGANLSAVFCLNSNFTSTDFSGATINGSSGNGNDGIYFGSPTGLTAAQLYSTASYQNLDLDGVGFQNVSVAGWNFAGQNLTFALFRCDVTGADFSGTRIYGADLENNMTPAQLYSTASYANHDLSFVRFGMPLAGFSFASQNLYRASFTKNDLAGVDFTGAVVASTNFSEATGFTRTQLYSTGSYADHDLEGINLEALDLKGWSFAEQDLSGAYFMSADLTHANFAGATIAGAHFDGNTNLTQKQFYSTASYIDGDLGAMDFSGATFAGWNFAGENLAGANLNGSTIDGSSFAGGDLENAAIASASARHADFSGADLQGVSFNESNISHASFSGARIQNTDFSDSIGFTKKQLYSTASYAQHALQGVNFSSDDLKTWNLQGQDLRLASFNGALLAGADFSDADLRGAAGFLPDDTTITQNTILPDGTIGNLNLGRNETLVVRSFYVPITVNSQATFDPRSTLEMVIDGSWNSTMEFTQAPALSGTLNLAITPGTDADSLVGETFQLFDWNAPLPAGDLFSGIVTDPGFTWDLSGLKPEGSVTIVADTAPAGSGAAPVPEPGAFLLLALPMAGLLLRRRRQFQCV